jgi:hypothetical protein
MSAIRQLHTRSVFCYKKLTHKRVKKCRLEGLDIAGNDLPLPKCRELTVECSPERDP